jgi:hypothetical protein
MRDKREKRDKSELETSTATCHQISVLIRHMQEKVIVLRLDKNRRFEPSPVCHGSLNAAPHLIGVIVCTIM